MSSDATFGHVEGVPPGSWFPDRHALHEAGVHRPLRAGICGRATEGYRYDGLYRVTRFGQAPGRDGYLVWRYRLEAIDGETQLP